MRPAEVEPSTPRPSRAERRRLLAAIVHRGAARRQQRRRLVLLVVGGTALALGILGALALRWPS